MKPGGAGPVRAYYERNTRLFLALGAGARARTIHRAVWAGGARTAAQAVHTTHALVLDVIAQLPQPAGRLHMLDLGCGVGGSLFYLAQRLEAPFHATGVTISPLQARLARERADRIGAADRCRFVEGDFMALPELEPAHLAFSIEAFVHSPDPQRYFDQASAALTHTGRLVVCDDFLSDRGAAPGLPAREALWLRAYREGWRVPGLSSVPSAVRMAQNAGLSLTGDRDLTPDLRLVRLPERLVTLGLRLGRAMPDRWSYWHSTVGSLALQQCLRAGLVEYRFLVFQKSRIA